MAKIKFNSYEQTAYCWVRIIMAKVNDIIRNPKYYGENERNFSEIFNGFSEEQWRSIYLELANKIETNYKETDVFSQSTAKRGHLFINDVLSIPDINLSVRQKKPFSIDMFSKNVYISNNSRKRLPNGYDDSHNYVLNGNEEELEFYNLVYNVISSIRIKDKRIKSLNQIRRIFCEKYCEVNNIPFKNENGNYTKEYRGVLTKFDSVIRTFKAYSIIKVEPRGKRNIIREWPIIHEDCIENQYSDLIITEFNKLEAKRVRTYVPPTTREDRRMFNGYARYKKAKLIQEKLKLLQNVDGGKLPLSIEINEDEGTIELRKDYPGQFSGIYSVSYNVLLPNDFSVDMLDGHFMLRDDVATIEGTNIEIQSDLKNDRKVAIIEEKHENIIVRYEAEILGDSLVYTNVSIKINNGTKREIKYTFTADEFKKIWYYIQHEKSNYAVSPKTVVDEVPVADSASDVDIVSRIPAGYRILYGLYSGNYKVASDINARLRGFNWHFEKVERTINDINERLEKIMNEIALPSVSKRIDRYLELSKNVDKDGKHYRKAV